MSEPVELKNVVLDELRRLSQRMHLPLVSHEERAAAQQLIERAVQLMSSEQLGLAAAMEIVVAAQDEIQKAGARNDPYSRSVYERQAWSFRQEVYRLPQELKDARRRKAAGDQR